MIKCINHLVKNPKLRVKQKKYNFSSLQLNSYFIIKILQKYWDTYLAINTHASYDTCINKKKKSLYFLQIHISPKINYLVLAKIIKLLSNKKIIRTIIEILKKIYFKISIFSNNSYDILIKNWLSILCLEEFFQYIKGYNIYLTQSIFFDNWDHNKIQWLQNVLLFLDKDYLLLKEYTNCNKIWQSNLNIINKNKVMHQLLNINNKSNGISSLRYELKFHTKNGISSTKTIYPYNLFQIYTKINKLTQKKYTYLIKNILFYKKINFQENLIKKINILIKYWNFCVSKMIEKECFHTLNDSFNQKCLKWAIFRHMPKAIKWIKNRYWNKILYGTCFSQF